MPAEPVHVAGASRVSRNDIHQLTVYVVGPHENLIAAWQAVVAAFDMNVPPSTLLGVTVLGHRGQLVEVDAVVAQGLARRIVADHDSAHELDERGALRDRLARCRSNSAPTLTSACMPDGSSWKCRNAVDLR